VTAPSLYTCDAESQIKTAGVTYATGIVAASTN
jgi:hypothetical protein